MNFPSKSLTLSSVLALFFVGIVLIVRFNLHRNAEYAFSRAEKYGAELSRFKLQEQSRDFEFDKQRQRLESLRNSGRMSQQEYEQRISLISEVQENAMMVDNGALAWAWRQIGDFFGH